MELLWSFRGVRAGLIAGVAVVLGLSAVGQEAPGVQNGPTVQQQSPAPVERQAPEKAPEAAEALPPGPAYDPEIFQNRVLPVDVAFLSQYAGAVSNEVVRDKRFKKVLHSAEPGVMFHYGRDMSLPDAMDAVLDGSAVPVVIREGRYVTIAGQQGKYLAGRGFIWVDLQEGIVLGGFFFHPTNGEPTPTVTVFSKQVKEDSIEMTQLPPAFNEDLTRWQMSAGIPAVTIRYFIGDENRKLLLEHDEDYCSAVVGRPGDDCMEMTADAADADVTAASYLDQVHYATNATAWMINSPDQVAWVGVRDRTCGGVLDPLGCRVRMTRERVHVIQRRSVGGGRRR